MQASETHRGFRPIGFDPFAGNGEIEFTDARTVLFLETF